MEIVKHVKNLIERFAPEDHPEDSDYDNGTMPDSVQALRDVVIGRKIVAVRREDGSTWSRSADTILELDNGTQVRMVEVSDCCAGTEVSSFLLDPASVDHMIMGVGTTDDFTTWHIYADFGDVLKLDVDWSCGNPFYYSYGFHIAVEPIVIDGDVIAADQPELEK